MGNKRKGAAVASAIELRNHYGAERLDARDIWPLLPLLVIVGIVPLVVFLKVTPVPYIYQQYWVSDLVFDFFSFYKARIILICALVQLMIVFVSGQLGRYLRERDVFSIPLGVYSLMVLSSSLLSDHPTVAYWGFFERSEGMLVLLSYVVLLVAAYLFVTSARQAWIVLFAGAIAVSVICVLGIFQYLGMDFFSTMVGRHLIIPTQYSRIASTLSFNFPLHTIYATLYNPNNVAGMMAISFPLALTCFLLARRWPIRAMSGVLAGLSCITLIGSNGRGGWVAALLALFLLFVLSPVSGSIRGWKWPVALLLICAVGITAIDQASEGAVSLRAKGIWTEFTGILMPKGDHNMGCKIVAPPANGLPEGLAERVIRSYGTVASFRGYIWVRSLQMTGNTLLLGRGPDTFALYFPNTDPYKACVSAQIFFDKPHNLYLQMWLNIGGVATLAFLAMLVLHTINTQRALKMADKSSDLYVLAAGLYAGWVGFLLAACFYDSSVHVAPIFWVVFGMGLAMNRAIYKSALSLPAVMAEAGRRSRG